jgi:Flp pilus assembly protein TadG
MFRSIGKLMSNTRGAFAMQFALMAVPLTICTGLAVDGGRAFLARFELASALDAAALAVGSTLQNQGTDLNAVAAKFVEKNFRTEHTGPIVLTMTSVEDTIVLKGSVKINTYFMPIVGQPTVTVNAESEVKRGGSSLEIALALDITGSMSTSRMNGLKNAARILVSEVVNDVQAPFFSKVAIVPWSQAINLDLATNPRGFVPAAALDQLRRPLVGTKAVSGASWRAASTTNKTITQAGWRTTTGAKTISNVDWRWGAAQSATLSVDSGRIRATTGSNHGYSDGQFVRLTGTSGNYSSQNNTIYMISYLGSKTFQLKDRTSGSFISAPSNGTSSVTLQRCYDKDCNVAVTTSSDLGEAAGSFVNLSGISGTFSSINNSATTTWTVTPVPSSNTFILPGSNGPSFTGTASTNGSASECLVSDCRYRVTTSSAHGFSANDTIAIWNLSEANSGTSAINAVNTSWSVQYPVGTPSTVFYLPGNGKTYKDWTSSSTGLTAKCALSSCNTRITVADNNMNVGESVELAGIAGPTGLNNASSSPSKVLWKINDKNGAVLTLTDTGPSISNQAADYSSGGTMQCLNYGCAKIGYTLSGTSRVWPASPCIVERYGDDRYTDVSPATAPLGINYTSNGNCTRTNYVQPMTSNKDNLYAHINALSTGGNTAGQLGIGWAWYMLSPNFASVWNGNAENAAKPYGTRELAKIAILMTDGEFNAQTCDGLYSSSDCAPHMPNDVPGPSASFRQARKICDAMKAKNIIIYTVGLEINTAQYSDDFLSACATGPQYAFLANNSAELEQAFKDIAVSINRLRISR